MVDYQLAQLISKEPTRVNAKSQTLTDVFITNKEDNISHSGVYTLSISDHNLILYQAIFSVRMALKTLHCVTKGSARRHACLLRR